MTSLSSNIAAPAAPPADRTAAAGWRAWIELTKPRIVMLMLVTCWAGMVLAADGLPAWSVLAPTLLGLAASIGGASALNHVLDRDLDRRMARTRMRPVASGAVGPVAAAAYGISLFTLGGAFLSMYVGPLTAWLALLGGIAYVAVYTPLKRVTHHNTVIGGIAGAVPPLVGWSAVAGDVASPLAWTLFAIMFCWQPAHFWPLSLLARRDYAAAGFVMLPITRGERATVRATWRWTWYTVAATLIPLATRDAGLVYAVAALGANAFLVRRMWALVTADRARGADESSAEPLIAGSGSPGNVAARRAFLASLTWLAVIFIGLVVDVLVG